MLAVERGYDAIVRILLDCGASINAVDRDHSTMIMLAVANGHGRIVSMLRESGASMDIRNNDDQSVFMLAADFGDFVIMRELLGERLVLAEAVGYLNAGMPEINAETQATISTDQVLKLCAGMRDALCLFSNIHSRLRDLENSSTC